MDACLRGRDAYEPNPKGSAIFEANGRFSVILMRGNLPKYASNNRTQGTATESKATVEGSLAYFGTLTFTSRAVRSRIGPEATKNE
jgi:uncharacterized membrane protein YcaP (DUF421 family)